MSNLGFSFKFPTLFRDEEGRSPSRPGVRLHVNLETLEGRALLSQVPVMHAAPAAQAGGQPAAFVQLPKHPHPGPIVNNVGVGYAVKSPRFYEFYTGAYRAELNAAGMKATYDASGNLILTGIVAGPITTTPMTDAGSEYYVFGIDRGLSAGIAPFPGRPRIKYDALVAVEFTPGGVSGAVLDMSTGTVTQIDPSGIVVQGGYQGGFSQDFKVYVPAGTPGIAGPVAGAVNPKSRLLGSGFPPHGEPESRRRRQLRPRRPQHRDCRRHRPDPETAPALRLGGIRGLSRRTVVEPTKGRGREEWKDRAVALSPLPGPDALPPRTKGEPTEPPAHLSCPNVPLSPQSTISRRITLPLLARTPWGTNRRERAFPPVRCPDWTISLARHA